MFFRSLLSKYYIAIARRHYRAIILAIISFALQFALINLTPILPGLTFAQPPIILCNSTQLLEGIKSYQNSNFKQAEELWEQAAQHYQINRNNWCRAKTLSNLALAYQQNKKLSQALTTNQLSWELISSTSSLSNSPKPSKTQVQNFMRLWEDSSNYKEQLRILAQVLNTQGKLKFFGGNTEESLENFRLAHTVYQQVNDQDGILRSLINQAQALQVQGRYIEAKRALFDALLPQEINNNNQDKNDKDLETEVIKTLESLSNSPLKAILSNTLANTYLALGDYPQARKIIKIPNGEKNAEAWLILGNIELAEASRDRYIDNLPEVQAHVDQSLNYYRDPILTTAENLTLFKAQLNDLSILLDTKLWLNNNYSDSSILMGDLKIKRNKLEVFIDQNIQEWVNVFNNQPSKLTKLQDYKLPLNIESLNAVLNLNKNLIKLRQLKIEEAPSKAEIVSSLNSVIENARKLENKRAESYAYGFLGHLYEIGEPQEWTTAIAYSKKAFDLAQEIDLADISYQWEWQIGRIYQQQGKIEDAIALYEDVAKILQSLRNNLTGTSTEVQFDLRDNVEPLYRELVNLLLPLKDNNLSQHSIKKSRDYIESLQLVELENFLRCQLNIKKPREISQVVNQQNANTAVIYPIILEDCLEVILELPNSPQPKLIRYYHLINRTQLEQTIKDFRLTLTQKDVDRKKSELLSQKLYELIIGDANKYLTSHKIKTLVFVLDGLLKNIPMSALWDGKQFLLEKYSIAVTPGLEILGAKPLKRQQLKALIAGITTEATVTVEDKKFNFDPLPNVKNETESIKSILNNSVVLLNENFQLDNFRTEINASNYPIIHLATHGNFSSNPSATFIVTTANNYINVNQLQNLLKTKKSNISDAIELLIFSACETAKGDKRSTLGMAGVAIQAGAESTIATLWSVKDESTSLLMQKFYQNLNSQLKPQLTKSEALQQAQLYLLQNGYRNPFYWSPFVLVGNWL